MSSHHHSPLTSLAWSHRAPTPIEESDDTRALVLELVEGPTLADRIKQGPIPVDEALPIAKQIAEARKPRMSRGSSTAI